MAARTLFLLATALVVASATLRVIEVEVVTFGSPDAGLSRIMKNPSFRNMLLRSLVASMHHSLDDQHLLRRSIQQQRRRQEDVEPSGRVGIAPGHLITTPLCFKPFPNAGGVSSPVSLVIVFSSPNVHGTIMGRAFSTTQSFIRMTIASPSSLLRPVVVVSNVGVVDARIIINNNNANQMHNVPCASVTTTNSNNNNVIVMTAPPQPSSSSHGSASPQQQPSHVASFYAMFPFAFTIIFACFVIALMVSACIRERRQDRQRHQQQQQHDDHQPEPEQQHVDHHHHVPLHSFATPPPPPPPAMYSTVVSSPPPYNNNQLWNPVPPSGNLPVYPPLYRNVV